MFLTGRAVIATAAGAVAVLLVPQPGVAAAWLAAVTGLVLLDTLLAANPRGVDVRREIAPSVRLGERAESVVTIGNPGPRRLRGAVRDAWVPSAGTGHNRHPVDVPAGERRRVRTTLVPVRRGRRTADLVTLRSLGPLGLAGRQVSREAPAAIMVLPPFTSRRHLPSRLERLRQLDGRTAVMVRGQGTEFDSLREYVIGDDVRAIDWRATARAGDVVVRTWRPERDRRVLIVVDSGRLSAVRLGEGTRFDAQLEATLLLAALASHAGDRVSVVAVDTEVRVRVTGLSGARLLNAVALQLADVEPVLAETNWTRVAAVVHETLSQHALVVLLTALDPSSLGNGLLPVARALAAEHTVVLASATDPLVDRLLDERGDSEAVYAAAAAEQVALERDLAEARLRHRGVHVLQATSDDLPPTLADEYLRLKRAGRL